MCCACCWACTRKTTCAMCCTRRGSIRSGLSQTAEPPRQGPRCGCALPSQGVSDQRIESGAVGYVQATEPYIIVAALPLAPPTRSGGSVGENCAVVDPLGCQYTSTE